MATYANHVMSKEVEKGQKSQFLTISYTHFYIHTIHTDTRVSKLYFKGEKKILLIEMVFNQPFQKSRI